LARKYYILGILVVIIVSALLIGLGSPFRQQEEASQVEPEEVEEMEDEMEDEIEAEDEEPESGEIDDSDTLPVQSGSTFEHKVEQKINGVVEENRGDGWWELD
jgi:flagellar biosynthesis/type III secretory pathway M-ring protein FliF/YscJ